jgi:hypothetical protein
MKKMKYKRIKMDKSSYNVNEKFSKELEIIKNIQIQALDLNNSINEIKNILESFNSKSRQKK